MLKSAIILFVVCFLLYLPFSRQPDYFDSETAPATIKLKDGRVVAEYSEYGKYYAIKVDSMTYHNRIGARVEVIYELREPAHAKINQASLIINSFIVLDEVYQEDIYCLSLES